MVVHTNNAKTTVVKCAIASSTSSTTAETPCFKTTVTLDMPWKRCYAKKQQQLLAALLRNLLAMHSGRRDDQVFAISIDCSKPMTIDQFSWVDGGWKKIVY